MNNDGFIDNSECLTRGNNMNYSGKCACKGITRWAGDLETEMAIIR